MSNLSAVVASVSAPRRSGTSAVATRRCNLPAFSGGRGGTLDAALRHISTVRSAPQHGQWTIRTPGSRRTVQVELSAAWLNISLPLRRLSKPISPEIIASTLNRNARTCGGARIVGQRRQGGREVVADLPVDLLPWDNETELQLLLGSTIAELEAALGAPAQCSESPPQAAVPLEQVEAVFAEAGWPAQQGETGCLEVPLDVAGNYFVACVDHDSPSLRLTVPILAAELRTAATVCRSALSVLLWLTASRMRMVNPVRSRRAMALEIALPPGQCNAISLSHACAALSVALQQCAAEAALLIADERLAQRYLSILGFPASP